MLVLAVECSTSSGKALLYDTDKGITASESRRYPPEIDRDGMTDTDAVFRLTAELAKKVADGRDVAAVALCGTWHSLAACSADFVPMAPTFSWNFLGSSSVCREMRRDRALAGKFYSRTGCMPHSVYVRHSLQYLKSQGFDYSGCRFLSQGGYAFFKLTGEWAESKSTQCGSGLENIRELAYDEFALDYFGLKSSQLGPLVTYEDTRPLTAEGARLLGLRPGIPVVPAHPDGALNQIGNYADRPGIMTLSIGTSSAIRVAADRPILPESGQLWCYYGVKRWMSGAACSSACNAIDWFRGKYLGGRFSFDELENGLDKRADVPVCLPFVFGERNPGWHDDAKCAFFGIDSGHTLQSLYRSLQMGILFNLYDCYRVLAEEGGAPTEIIASGGGTHSAAWTQMLADIFKKDILVAKNPNASSIGAAALALHAAGALDDVDDFRVDFDNAVRYTPDESMYGYYDAQFARYREVYEREMD